MYYCITQEFYFWTFIPDKKTYILTKTCTHMFIVGLFQIAKKLDQLKYPSVCGWLNKLWHICIMGYYLSIIKKLTLDTHNHLDGSQEIMLSGGKKSVSKVTYYEIPLT